MKKFAEIFKLAKKQKVNVNTDMVSLGKASILTKGTGHMGQELFGKWGK